MDSLIKKTLNDGIISERLKMRKLNENDECDMFEYTSNSKTCSFLQWGPHENISETKAFIQKTMEKYCQPNDIVWGIELLDQKKLIGVIRIYGITDNDAEVSYILNEHYTGHGYMTECVSAVIDICFGFLKRNRVIAFYTEGNEASRKVMERCNMQPCLRLDKNATIKGRTKAVHGYEIWRKQ